MPLQSHRHQHFIESRIAPWLLKASAPERERFLRLTKASTASARAAGKLLAALPGPEAFARPLLAAALRKQFNLDIDVGATELVRASRNEGWLESKLQVSQATLLEAAMQNFHPEEPPGVWSVLLPVGELSSEFYELASGRISRRWQYDKRKALALAPNAFAAACRQLDLGRLYQQRIDAVLGATGAASQLQAHFLDSLATQAQQAFMCEHLDAAGRDCLLAYAQGAGAVWSGGAVAVSTLTILVSAAHSGYELVGPLVFQRKEGGTDCIVYLPGEHDQPLTHHPSLADLEASLRERLRAATYRAWFKSFVAHDEQAAFLHRLFNTLSPLPVSLLFPEDRVPDPSADIGIRASELPGESGPGRHQQWRERFAHNAAKILVPTAETDREAREQRLKGYLAEGLTLLNVAAFFVPGLGAIMLGVGAVQLFADIFVGIDDWRHGQTEEALDHLGSVVESLAMVAASAGAGLALKRSPFMENMELVADSGGKERLWHSDMQAYRTPDVLPGGLAPDGLGLYWSEGKAYIRIDEHCYQVEKGQGSSWAVVHPLGEGRYCPGVAHNGEGAWQLLHERPDDWQGVTLMRRWGALVEALDDEQLSSLQGMSGVSDAQLRLRHVQRAPMPALLKDSLARWKLAQRLGGASFEQAYHQLQVDTVAGADVLRRDFPGVPSALAEEILGQANDAERASLLRHSRVPLRLAEQARQALRHLRLNRAIEGLYFSRLRSADSRRLGAGFMADLPDDVANSLERDRALARLAAQQRSRAAAVLGQRQVQPWFRSPLRSAGRLGYELSGRGLPGWLPDARLRRLYPLAGDAEVAVLREAIELRTVLERGIDALERQYERLQAGLEQWVQQPGSYLNAEGASVEVPQASRQQAAGRILAAWRRETPLRRSRAGLGHGFSLNLAHLHLGELPSLGPGFDHIERLLLDDMQLGSDPSDFLRHLPSVRFLGLTENRLVGIPRQVARMVQLQGLDLRGNRLVGSSDSFLGLGEAPALQELLLEGNAIERLPVGWPAPDSLPRLQRLDISDNGLQLDDAGWQRIAGLPALRTLDLSLNQISLSPGARRLLAGMNRLRQLHLHYNPLQLAPDVSAMGQLRVLALSSTQISEIPPGLWQLLAQPRPNLLVVDLAHNGISIVPPMPQVLIGAGDGEVGMPRFIYFSIDANPLTEASIENLRVADEAVRVNISPVQGGVPVPVAVVDWGAGLPAALRDAIAQESEDPQGRLFFEVLARCTETADYRIDAAGTLARMRSIAESILLADGEGVLDLRDQLFEEAQDITGTCGDGVSLVINRFETVIAVWRAASSAMAGGEAMLPPLVRESERLLRLALVDERVMAIARARVRRRAAIRAGEPSAGLPALDGMDEIADQDLVLPVDEVELRLLVLRSLANPASLYALDLPAQPQNVLYGEVLSINTLAAIRNDVVRSATRPALLEWLSQQRYWATYLEKLHARAFDDVREQWAEIADYFEAVARSAAPAEPAPAAPSAVVYAALEQALPEITWRRDEVPQWPQMSEQQYLAGYDRLMTLRQQALAALVRQLTGPVLEAHSALPAT